MYAVEFVTIYFKSNFVYIKYYVKGFLMSIQFRITRTNSQKGVSRSNGTMLNSILKRNALP